MASGVDWLCKIPTCAPMISTAAAVHNLERELIDALLFLSWRRTLNGGTSRESRNAFVKYIYLLGVPDNGRSGSMVPSSEPLT